MMAAGGPKSAAFAGRYADGLITSVKQPEDTLAKVIEPYRRAAAERGAPQLVLATRWTVLAENDDEAWHLPAADAGPARPGAAGDGRPGRAADAGRRDGPGEVLASYTCVPDAAGLIGAYRPLVTDVGADIVSIQVMSEDPMATIRLIGKEVLPPLRSAAAP